MLPLLSVALALVAAPERFPARRAPELLHCRVEVVAGGKSERCKITIPPGRGVRSCTDADRVARHCDAAGNGNYVAWVVGTGPGRCRISKKRTRWDRVVSAKLSRSKSPSTCDLYVALQ